MAQARFIWQRDQWPNFVVDVSQLTHVLGAARREQGRVIGMAHAIGLQDLTQVTRDIWTDEAVATAAIEGERLDLAAVRSSVMRRLGMPPVAHAPVSRPADGLLDVMQDATASFANPLTVDQLKRWQAALFPAGTSGILQIVVGRYRDAGEPMQIVSGPVGRETVHYEAPAAATLAAEMRRFLHWFEQFRPHDGTPGPIDGLVRAAVAHLWFETIHPFEDGNGRVGRAIVDRALAQDAASGQRLYSMATQLLRERDAYYSQLEQAQRGDLDVTRWVAWFVTQFHLACEASQRVMAEAMQRNRFWTKHADVPLNERQRKVLARLLDAGQDGFEGGLTASKYVALTRAAKATATRDLVQLQDAGMLVTSGQGRSTRYWISLPGWKPVQKQLAN